MILKTYCVPGTHSPPLIPSLGVSLPSGDTIVMQISKATPRLQQSYGGSKDKRPRDGFMLQEMVHNGFQGEGDPRGET